MNLPDVKAYTVTGLNREIKNLLDAELGSVWVEGEISNLRTPYSGHSYFTLKDKNAQIRSVLFKGQKSMVRFEIEDGQQVLVRGRITVYEPRGDYQIIVDYMEPKGYGALQKAFEQLKEKLSKEGLFDEQYKKPIPYLPQKIGVVTTATGAAIRDILQVLDRRFSNVEVLIAPAKVQGEGAAEEIASAIHDLNLHGQAEVIIVGRGGGSLEDLWAFNEEVVARAIFGSRIPIISAVGHEIDFTIADFTADLRAPTPSAAAEMVIPNKADLQETVLSLKKNLVWIMESRLENLREKLSSLRERRFFREPGVLYEAARQRLDYLALELERNSLDKIKDQRTRLDHFSRSLELLSPSNRVKAYEEKLYNLSRVLGERARQIIFLKKGELEKGCSRLDALSPLATLSRGYSICRTPGKKVVRDSGQVNEGDELNLLLHKGELFCRVEGKREG